MRRTCHHPGPIPRRAAAAAAAVTAALTLTTASGASAATGPLSHWRAAVAARRTAPATWLAVGDSFTEGQGASALTRRWINQTLARLRQAAPVAGAPGGIGYLPAWDYVQAPDSPWTPYRSRTAGTSDVGYIPCLGDLAARLTRGAAQTYAISGTSADVHYATLPGGGTFTYRVDGAGATSVSTNRAAGSAGVVRVRFSRNGNHSLTITATAGNVYLEGVRGYAGDENRGLRLVTDAHAGFSSGAYLGQAARRAPLLAALAPDLVTLEWGVNDYRNATASPSTLAAHLRSEIASLRTTLARKPPSIVLVLPWSPGTGANTLGFTWAEYATAIRGVADADPSVGLLDHSSIAAGAGNLSATDGLHATDQGQAALADLTVSYLTGG